MNKYKYYFISAFVVLSENKGLFALLLFLSLINGYFSFSTPYTTQLTAWIWLATLILLIFSLIFIGRKIQLTSKGFDSAIFYSIILSFFVGLFNNIAREISTVMNWWGDNPHVFSLAYFFGSSFIAFIGVALLMLFGVVLTKLLAKRKK